MVWQWNGAWDEDMPDLFQTAPILLQLLQFAQ